MSESVTGQVPENIEQISTGEYSRDEQAQKVIKFMERIHAKEVFGSEESKRQYIQDITFEDFSKLLTATNFMLRDIPINKKSFDGEHVYLGGGFD
jgi:hypothetical protein